MSVRALRGATTVDVDERDHVRDRVVEMLQQLVERNGLDFDDLISAFFTATSELNSVFPATAAREYLPADLPLLCAQEMNTVGALGRCIRVMLHVETPKSRSDVSHVFLHGARVLRPDLVDPE
jgi:chorismate mutase